MVKFLFYSVYSSLLDSAFSFSGERGDETSYFRFAGTVNSERGVEPWEVGSVGCRETSESRDSISGARSIIE